MKTQVEIQKEQLWILGGWLMLFLHVIAFHRLVRARFDRDNTSFVFKQSITRQSLEASGNTVRNHITRLIDRPWRDRSLCLYFFWQALARKVANQSPNPLNPSRKKMSPLLTCCSKQQWEPEIVPRRSVPWKGLARLVSQTSSAPEESEDLGDG